MRLDYDLDANALYITLSDQPVAKTVEIEEETLVDVDSAGGVVGIEVITIDRVWALEEILRRYPIADADRRQLQALFPVGEGVRRETPAITARSAEPVFALA